MPRIRWGVPDFPVPVEVFPRDISDLKYLRSLNIENNRFQHRLPTLTLPLDEKSIQSWNLLEQRIRRRQVVDELLSTEREYVSKLRKIRDYLVPVQKQNIVSEGDFRSMFVPFEMILKINDTFLKELTGLLGEHQAHDTYDIGGLFVEHKEEFKLYNIYINDYPTFIQKFESEMEKNRKFYDYWTKLPEFSRISLVDISKVISNYFITPIQRIPRYQILLQELKKNTPTDHPLYESLSVGLVIIREIAEYCNLKKMEKECMNRVIDIAKELRDQSISKPMRYIMYEIPQCKKVEIKKKDKHARIYLFNDMCMIMEHDKTYKFDVQYLTMERPLDTENRLRILSTGYDSVFEFENLITLEELFELWYDQARFFWMTYFQIPENTATPNYDTPKFQKLELPLKSSGSFGSQSNSPKMSPKFIIRSEPTTSVNSPRDVTIHRVDSILSNKSSPDLSPNPLNLDPSDVNGQKSRSQSFHLGGFIQAKKLSKLRSEGAIGSPTTPVSGRRLSSMEYKDEKETKEDEK
jgi:hypothetical protein